MVSTMFCKEKSARKKKLFFFSFGNFRQLPTKKFQIWDNFFPLLFPKDFKFKRILDIQLQEVGATRRLNSTPKVTRQTDKSTYRKHRPKGPMLWKVGTKLFYKKFIHFWAFFLLCNLVSNNFTIFFRGSEVCLERRDSYGNFGF